MRVHSGMCQRSLGKTYVLQHLWMKGSLGTCATSVVRGRFLFGSVQLVTNNCSKSKLVEMMMTFAALLCQGPLNFSLSGLCGASFLHTI